MLAISVELRRGKSGMVYGIAESMILAPEVAPDRSSVVDVFIEGCEESG